MAAVLLISLISCGGQSTGTDSGNAKIKIGVMQFGEFTALTNAYNGFIEGLKEDGYEDGKNIEIKYLSASADTANCPTIADSLINDGSDLIFAIATPSVSCLKEKTKDIPILFTAVTDPVLSGFFDDAKNPGTNISGTSDMNPVREQIELLCAGIENVKKVVVFYCSSESNSKTQFDLAKAALEEKNIECIEKTISTIDEAKSVLESIPEDVNAIYIPTDNTLADAMPLVSAITDEMGIPVICGETGMVESGGTASFGIDYFNLGKQTAKMAIRIFTSKNPLETISQMPVEYQTEDCKYVFNKKSCEKTGFSMLYGIEEDYLIYE